MKVSVVIPCRNEEKTIGICIKKIHKALQGYDYEVIVSDSSVDNSAKIAKRLGAVVASHDKDGYGNAYLEGFKRVSGDVVVIGDADNTYDFAEIPRFIKEIKKGSDFVIGSRFKGNIKKGAMPWLHKHIGNPFLTWFLSLAFGKRFSDTHSGFRAITKNALDNLRLQTTGMEFASEMIIKAIKNKLKITEIPITYSRRVGKSKLRSFNDGWKHLRFMLLYSPDFLFLFPGIVFFVMGFLGLLGFMLLEVSIDGLVFDIHPMFVASGFVIFGYQILHLWLFSRVYRNVHLKEKDALLSRFYKGINLEKGITFGILILLLGLLINTYILILWVESGFGNLDTLKLAIFAFTLMIVGIQTIFSSFFVSILGIKEN